MTDDLDELRHELRWRISCHRPIMAEGDVHGNKVRPVLLCQALDIDDSWVHLIDKPVGAAFKKNSATGLFEEINAPQPGFTESRSEDWWQIRVAKAKQ